MATQQTPSNDRAVATMPECNNAGDVGLRKVRSPDRNRNSHPGCNIGRTLDVYEGSKLPFKASVES